MPKRSFRTNTKKESKNVNKKKNENAVTTASFPQSSISHKHKLQNKRFESKLQSKKLRNTKKQKKNHNLFIKRQNDTSLTPHQRIQELLGKNRNKNKKNKHKKNKKNKKQKNSLSSLKSIKQIKNNNSNHQTNNHLEGAQFRWMNEMLYNTTGNEAQNKIKNYKQEFIEYHQTYTQIVQNEWPESPLQKIIKSITKKLAKIAKVNQNKPNNDNEYFMADFGCGDAKIAKFFDKDYNDNKNNKITVNVKSFDLISLNKYVTACNINDVPLDDKSMNLVIFCLSLMGTDFHEYLIEAHRVLKANGLLKIAEVRSRFYGINKFEKFLNRCGFDVVAKDLDNSHFALFHCKKTSQKMCQSFPSNFDAKTVLKPCAYKKR